MKPVRLLCATVALFVCALAIGPTSAQATAFCEVNEDPCEAEDTLGVPVEFELSLKEGSEAILSNGIEISAKSRPQKAR